VGETFGQSMLRLAETPGHPSRSRQATAREEPMFVNLLRPLALCIGLTLPALIVRFAVLSPAPILGLLLFGMAVVAASFVLAWAAEAAQVDISGGLAIAILAVIAVLPEYAVDLYFAYAAGHNPDYVAYATANMTGSNRLLLGLGWSLVVLVALAIAKRRTGKSVRALTLESGYRVELGFLAIATVVAFLIPATGQIPLLLGFALLGFFGFYLSKVSRSKVEEPDLVGPAAAIGQLPKRARRILVASLFVFAAAVILACAEPFAHALIGTGTQLGIDKFLLVQWLGPLASETPEFIVAVLFAVRGNGAAAIGTLISSKVNQWTLLVGSLPVAYLTGGGTASIHLDARQVEEFLLTAAQTLLGIAALLTLRFPRWAARTLLGLFAAQFALPGQTARYLLCGIYTAIALAALIHNRTHILPTLAAPFRRAAADTDSQPTAPTQERDDGDVSERRLRTVALIGVDGSGKTTQAHRLAAALTAAGIPATYSQNAGGRRWFGRLARRLGYRDAQRLLGRNGMLLTESVLRWLAIARALLRSAPRRRVAVMDRYTFCQYARIRIHGAQRWEPLTRLLYRIFPPPEVTFLLSVRPSEAHQRIEARGTDHESLDYLAAADAAYRSLPECGSFVVIDANATPDEVTRTIEAHVYGWLRNAERRTSSPVVSSTAHPAHLHA
jgi:cation:H+ antiporter